MDEEHLKAECERSFYEVLYREPSGERAVVKDRVSGRVWFEKTLSIYDTGVFRYLKEHPNMHVPVIHSFWEESGKLIVIEELVSGYSLDYLLANGIPDDAEKTDILLQVCDGLEFLHGADPQIIHRDIKPSNIMVTDGGIVKIIDYDAAKLFDAHETKDTIQIGTRGNAAPEQYGFGKCDERTDIYGLGVMIGELFPDDGSALHRDMRGIAEKATRLSPEQRYQHAFEIRDQLAGLSGMYKGDLSGTLSGTSSGRKENRKSGNRSGIPSGGMMNQKMAGHEKNIAGINLPGFRSLTPWKMITAMFGYLGIIWLSFTYDGTRGGKALTGSELWINRLCIFALWMSLLDLFTDWSGLWRKAPPLHHESRAVRILSYAAFAAGIVVFWAFVCTAVVDIIS